MGGVGMCVRWKNDSPREAGCRNRNWNLETRFFDVLRPAYPVGANRLMNVPGRFLNRTNLVLQVRTVYLLLTPLTK